MEQGAIEHEVLVDRQALDSAIEIGRGSIHLNLNRRAVLPTIP